MTGKAEWTGQIKAALFDTTPQRVRNVLPIKINEVRVSTGANPTNQFIELYNASANAVDMSNWTLANTQSQWAPVKLATIPAGTTLRGGAYYLLGLSNSSLAAPADRGATIVNVRSIAGLVNGQKIDIDGETRSIVNVGTEAAPMTTVFAPVSTGPWITIRAGSTNLPVANTTGFEVGQKIGIDIGGNHEQATVTGVGKAATQTTLSAATVAGATNIKVVANANMTAGDTLTIGTARRKELVTVASVGTAGATGTGVSLAAPLRFDHVVGIDVSDVGTGISFSPATKFPHISGDAVQALGSGITLDSPLINNHTYGAAVANAPDTAGGYQGPPAPNKWFGGPLSARAGSLALLNADGVVVDALVYGSQQSSSSANGYVTSPELATLEADQGRGGCIAVVPTPGRVGGPAPATAGMTDRSVGRFPDGADTDSNCTDFLLQAATTLQAGSAAGATNIKIAGATDLGAGQTIMIDAGANQETAVIATVGTAGATTVNTATNAGATVITVAGVPGFSAGQAITIDSGANYETASVASTAGGGRGGGPITVTVTAPLTFAHVAGAQVSGTGIALTGALTKAHAIGAQVAAGVPTPGASNQYSRKTR